MARNDCDSCELTVMGPRNQLKEQVYYSRPLFHLSQSTPLAGKALHWRLKALIRRHATYYPPPASLSSLKREPVRPVPDSILTNGLVERILTETCFVGGVMTSSSSKPLDENMEGGEEDETERALALLADVYASSSTATDLPFPIPSVGDIGPGTLVVPGWIRERAAEVLFEDDMESESLSVTDTVLQTLAKVSSRHQSGLSLNTATYRLEIEDGGNDAHYGRNRLPSWIYLPPPHIPQERPSSSSFCRTHSRCFCTDQHPCFPKGRNEAMAAEGG